MTSTKRKFDDTEDMEPDNKIISAESDDDVDKAVDDENNPIGTIINTYHNYSQVSNNKYNEDKYKISLKDGKRVALPVETEILDPSKFLKKDELSTGTGGKSRKSRKNSKKKTQKRRKSQKKYNNK